jgi:hypothetical protein
MNVSGQRKKGLINDLAISHDTTYSSEKIETLLGGHVPGLAGGILHVAVADGTATVSASDYENNTSFVATLNGASATFYKGLNVGSIVSIGEDQKIYTFGFNQTTRVLTVSVAPFGLFRNTTLA